MGFVDKEEGKFFTIYQGKCTVRVPEGTPNAISRVNKMGKTVYEVFRDSFVGTLTGITTKDGEYGKMWNFSFKDEGETYTLTLPYSNSYAKAFLKMLPNIDLTKKMKVSPSLKEEDGKPKTTLFINQDGVAIKHKYTRENPNGLPEMERITVKGQEVWDDTKQLAFLEEMIKRDIRPKLGAALAVAPAPQVDIDGESTEEIPF